MHKKVLSSGSKCTVAMQLERRTASYALEVFSIVAQPTAVGRSLNYAVLVPYSNICVAQSNGRPGHGKFHFLSRNALREVAWRCSKAEANRLCSEEPHEKRESLIWGQAWRQQSMQLPSHDHESMDQTLFSQFAHHHFPPSTSYLVSNGRELDPV